MRRWRVHQAGDVIYIEANSGAVKRVGRCDAYATEFDLEAEEYVPLPKVGSGRAHDATSNRPPAGDGAAWIAWHACKPELACVVRPAN